jgi:hypothetical protein
MPAGHMSWCCCCGVVIIILDYDILKSTYNIIIGYYKKKEWLTPFIIHSMSMNTRYGITRVYSRLGAPLFVIGGACLGDRGRQVSLISVSGWVRPGATLRRSGFLEEDVATLAPNVGIPLPWRPGATLRRSGFLEEDVATLAPLPRHACRTWVFVA